MPLQALIQFIIMAKGNFLMNTASGKLGSMVLYRAKGEQRARTYVKTVSNPKTYAQILQRSQLANVVANYRVLKTAINKGFEDKKYNQSDYNAFVSRNLNKTKIFLTKEMVAGKSAVCAPYQITSGSIAPIAIFGSYEDSYTNIGLGKAFVIDAATTVAAFSKAITSLNQDIVDGMQLAYVSMVQSNNAETGYPTLSANFYKVIIDKSDETLLYDHMPVQSVANKNGFLGHGEHVATGAFCWILSKKDAAGKLQVSPQTLIATDSEVFTYYSGIDAADAAALSYGAQAESFLSPVDNAAGQVEGVVAVSSVTVGTYLVREGFSRFSVKANDAFKILGSSLDIEALSIVLSSNEKRMTPQELGAVATPLSEAITAETTTKTQISGTLKTAVASVNQLAIISGSTVLFQVMHNDQEAPDPAA